MTQNELHIDPIAGALGAELSGVDLRQPLTTDLFQRIHEALLQHEVIFFRGQAITPAQHYAFAKHFGTFRSHPAYPHPKGFPEITILEHSEEMPSKIELWHTDMTFMERPPLGSILLSKITPKQGGDTLWSSMTAAYEGLSDSMKQFLSGLHAIHDFRHGFKESLAEPGGYNRLQKAIKNYPPISHPVIRTHPETGKKLIFVNRLFTTHIEGVKPKESQALLEFLWDHICSPEYTCRFRWQKDSIAFWDNRSTQHKPVNDHGLQHRVLHRITIEGDRPS